MSNTEKIVSTESDEELKDDEKGTNPSKLLLLFFLH